ncbi:TorF family putative porin [Phenylobacterium sp.]|uniref:TorF family putative porin n=1 Tax=Phenylobacterium sp. TaxID=1871053 RepID=UPI0025CFFF39|nr:TorF family putative porin [Phenylobacterium sp.]MBX3482841.1 TorF family putative porin [Phenylobacterium sp.]MCW5758303.1 TorF family putative porin [Phenylobacterium sp.]
MPVPPLSAPLAALLLVLAASPALAQEKPSVAFNAGAASDYVFRGVSQTDRDPQVYAGADVSLGAGYAGVWVSNVDFGNGTDAEFDLYAGVQPQVGAVTLDLGVLYYGYVDQPAGSHEDYWEFKATGSMPLGPATLGAGVFWSPENFGKTGDAVYYEANAAVTIPQTRVSVSAALGRQEVRGPDDYTTWNVGVGYALTDNVSLDLRYHDTDAHELGKLYDSSIVGGIKLTF